MIVAVNNATSVFLFLYLLVPTYFFSIFVILNFLKNLVFLLLEFLFKTHVSYGNILYINVFNTILAHLCNCFESASYEPELNTQSIYISRIIT